MVGNATEEGVITKLDHPSHRDPLRTVALLFLVAWLGAAFVLTLFALTLTLALVVAFIPVVLIFTIFRQIRIIRRTSRNGDTSASNGNTN